MLRLSLGDLAAALSQKVVESVLSEIGAAALINTARRSHSESSTGGGAPAAGTLPRAEVSVVVPVYNEAAVLPSTLPRILALAKSLGSCEVLVIDDGSSDSTLEIAGKLLEGYPRAELLWHPSNRGKGAAVKSGVSRARGRYVVFVDADLSPDLEAGVERGLRELERAHVAIASRAVEGAVVEGASLSRRVLGLGFRTFRRVFADLDVADTQCGLKAFRAEAAKVLFHFLTSEGFAFDVDLLMTAKELGLKVVEFPIKWRAVEPSSVRPLGDAVRMAAEVLKRRYFPRLPGPVPCVMVPAERWRAQDSKKVAEKLRTGDLVVEEGGKVAILLFSTPPQGARSVGSRLGAILDSSEVEVSSVGYRKAFEYARSALASLPGAPDPTCFFV